MKIKVAYRFADLSPAAEFYRTGDYTGEKLVVASVWDGAGNYWVGNSKKFMNENCQIEPEDKRQAAANKRKILADAAKRNGVAVAEVREAYRKMLAEHERSMSDERQISDLQSDELGYRSYLTLRELGLIVYYQDQFSGEQKRIVSGEYPSRVYL